MQTRPARTARGDATRGRIVETAAALLEEHGVDGLTLERVVAGAAVSKGQIYHYFSGRDELLRSAAQRRAAAVLSLQESLMGDLGDWDAIERWFDCLVQLQVDGDARGGCPLASMAAALVERDEGVRADLVAAFDAWESLLRRGLHTMQDQGVLRADVDVASLATATMASVQGGLVLTQVRRDAGQLRCALDAAMRHLRSYERRSG